MAVADGVTNFSSKEVLTKYQLGTSVNIKNLKKVATEKDLIDILPGFKQSFMVLLSKAYTFSLRPILK